MKQPQLNTTSVYRRLTQVGFAVALLIVVLNMWVDSMLSGNKVLQDNTASQVRLLLNQSAKVALHLLKDQQQEKLSTLLDDLATHPFILHAMVYDKAGHPVAQSQHAISAQQIYLELKAADGLKKTDSLNNTKRSFSSQDLSKTYIAEIIDGEKLVGYLRVSLQQQQAQLQLSTFHLANMQKALLMMLLSGLIGFLLTRGFARFSRNTYRIVE